MPLTLRYVARSDVGLVREGNEDSGYAGPYLLAVADGMGGHAAGEVASQAAIDELVHAERPAAADVRVWLAGAFEAANARIRQLILDEPSHDGMGTTATALAWNESELALGHIGDSRAYRLRAGALAQLTRDHTFVQSLVDAGQLSPQRARDHPARSVVTKVLQGREAIEPDYAQLDPQLGDRLLICSDGLSDVLSEDGIAAVLDAGNDLGETADELIRLTLEGGAPDNVTVVLAEIIQVNQETPGEENAESFAVGAAATGTAQQT